MAGQLWREFGFVRRRMKGRDLSRLLVLLALTVATTPAGAVLPGAVENPYGVITNRNAFGLHPPPEPDTTPPAPPPAAPPNVFLTGVSHQRGVKRAFFVINRPGAKMPDYESAAEGDEIQDLKVQEINAKEGKVRVAIGGHEVVLNFADNGMKGTGGAAVPPVPGGRPGGPNVAQPAAVAPVPQPSGAVGGPVVIGRGGLVRDGSASGGNAIPTPVYNGVTVGDGGGVPVPQPINTPNNQPVTRSLPNRTSTRVSGGADQTQPSGGAAETGGGGSIPIPFPPPTRFSP